jgi:hypothetical protein
MVTLVEGEREETVVSSSDMLQEKRWKWMWKWRGRERRRVRGESEEWIGESS